MPILKNKRHEKFALNIFKGMTQKDAAIEAGYKPSRARYTGYRLATYGYIFDRVQELHKEAASDGIMTVRQRKERLSEIGNARLTEYVTCGPDRDLINVGPESPNTGALQEVTSRTEYDKDGAGVAVITKIKLHSPTQAIDLLNKMEKIYEAEGKAIIDNRVLNIYVNSDKAKNLTERLIEGERTSGDNHH